MYSMAFYEIGESNESVSLPSEPSDIYISYDIGRVHL